MRACIGIRDPNDLWFKKYETNTVENESEGSGEYLNSEKSIDLSEN